MFLYHVYYFYDFNDSSYNDPDISLRDPNENKRFTLLGIFSPCIKVLQVVAIENMFILLTFWGLQFASISMLYDNYDNIVLLLIVILNIENYFKIIGQSVCNNWTIGTQTERRGLIKSTEWTTSDMLFRTYIYMDIFNAIRKR